MRRSLKNPTRKFSADSQHLATLAQSLAMSGSRLERRHWENLLDQGLEKLLGNNQQQAIDSALDHLFHTDPLAYEVLLDGVETISSSCRDRKSTRLNSSHSQQSRMPSSA